MTILDLVRIIRSNLKLLLLSLLLGMLLAAAYTFTRPVTYSATSSAQVMAGASVDPNGAMMSQQLASGRTASYAQLASGPGVAQRIVKLSNGSLKAGSFAITGAVSGGETSSTLTLVADASTPSKAQRAANLAPVALSQEIRRVETLNGAKSTIFDAYQLASAARPSAPSSPNWPVNLGLGAALGLVAGLVTVVLRKQLDSRIRHSGDLEKITGAGVLGVIPKAKNLQGPTRGGLGSLGTTSESFRMLRTNLRYVSAEQPPRSLVITSAEQGEGKSTVAANLARVLAAAGQRVVLVDTDLRRPVVHETFSLDNAVGLTEVLTGQVPLADVLQRSEHKNLVLVTSGRIPPNPSELLGSRRMSAVIESLEKEYFVILDAPPLLPVTDAGLIAAAADGAALVYHYGRTHREQIALCTKILNQVNATYFGSILNLTPQKEMGSAIYGYGAGSYGATGYGYGYGGYGNEIADPDAAAPTPAAELADLSLPTESDNASRIAAREDRNATELPAASEPRTAQSVPSATASAGYSPANHYAPRESFSPAEPSQVPESQPTGPVPASSSAHPGSPSGPVSEIPRRRMRRTSQQD